MTVMAEIILVRHGQASFGAANYDRLSELGEQQALWLGDYFCQLQQPVDAVVIGTLDRHRATAAGILQAHAEVQTPPETVHPGLNEYHFRELLAALQRERPQEWVDTGDPKRDYYHNIRQALGGWIKGFIASDGTDSWQSFCERINEAFEAVLRTRSGSSLVVSSGGPIAVILARVLNLDAAATVNLMLHIKNTSVSRILYNGRQLTLDSFNDVAHLQHAGRRHGITFS